MSNTGINTGFAKCFILFMSVVILVQGCGYLGLAIWGITLHSCSVVPANVNDSPLQFAVDLIYFANKECGNPTISNEEGHQTEIVVDWAKSSLVTNRTYIFLITYAAISAAWIVTSLMVAATICSPITKMISGFCYFPWFLVVMGGSVLDVVATVYHVIDITHTTTAAKTFAYLGLSAMPEVEEFLSKYDAYFVTPAIIMTAFSSRVVLVWLLNIFGTIFCLSLSNVLHKQYEAQETPPQPQPQLRPQQVLLEPRQLPQQEQQQAAQTVPVIAVPLAAIQRENSVQSPVLPFPPSAPAPLPLLPVSDATTYRNTESHPDRLDYPAAQSSGDLHSISPTELSAVSPLNNRYSTPDGFQYPAQNQPQRVSAELRSQLPWSYTSMQAKPQPPRKPQAKVYPDIPEPDYSLPQSRQDRSQTANAGGGDANSPQPQQTQQAFSRW